MSDVFILGAGFSIAVDHLHMPSTDALGNIAVRVQQSIHQARVTTHSNICDGLSCDRALLVQGHLPAPTFEVWLSRLAEPQPYLHEPENARNYALYRELAGIIAQEIARATDATLEQQSAAPLWLANLIRAWHERRVDVITFNYDTLIEATFDPLQLPHPERSEQQLSYRQIRPAVLPFWVVGYRGLRAMPADTFSLWKLHGSTNWYWDGTSRSADSMVDIGLRCGWGACDSAFNDRFRAPGKEVVLIPPIVGKSTFFENPLIRDLWRQAFEALRRAKRVFVIGYSLPAADLLVRAMLTEALTSTEVWVVDIDNTVASNFEKLGRVVNVNAAFVSETRPVEAFVDWYLAH